MENSNVTQCSFIEGGAFLNSGVFIRNVPLNESSVFEFRLKHDNKGIFTTAYRYSSDDQSKALLFGDLYFDFDTDLSKGEKYFLNIKKDVNFTLAYLSSMYSIPQDVVDLYFSGSKGIHLIVKKEYLGIQPHFNLNQVFRDIAEEIHGVLPFKTMDMKVYDRRRLWRLPNSKHNKSDLYKVPITIEEFNDCTLEEIKELAKSPRVLLKQDPFEISKAALVFKKRAERLQEKPKRKFKEVELDLKVTPPCIEELLNGNIQKGQRNNTAITVASFFRQQGVSQDDCMSKLIEWNETKCEEPLPQREIDMVVEHTYKEGYKYGCSGLRVLATCNRRKCPLAKY